MKMDKVAGSGNDEFYTPEYAVRPIVPYLEPECKTECDFIERYELFGFTKEDYEEVKELTKERFVQWDVPRVAREKGIRPQEVVARVIPGAIGVKLCFPHHVLRSRD